MIAASADRYGRPDVPRLKRYNFGKTKGVNSKKEWKILYRREATT